jgi:endogenous inhibitor of DNA gyrase (YacG/DUF329 family)
MKCPICHRKVEPASQYAPFCSDRCREVDLGNWASEKYGIPGPAVPDTEENDDPDDHSREA